MNKVYNKIDDVVNGFYDFFKNFSNSKTLLNFMPQFLCSIIDAESVTYSKIALSLFSNFNGNIKLDSHFKRIYRFLHNPHYNIHSIFDNVIYDVLSRFKLAHDDNNFHISFDHMFDKTNFTVFMLTLLFLCLLSALVNKASLFILKSLMALIMVIMGMLLKWLILKKGFYIVII